MSQGIHSLKAGKTKTGREFCRQEVEGNKPTISEPINSCIGKFHNECGQMMSDVWNVAKSLGVEYR